MLMYEHGVGLRIHVKGDDVRTVSLPAPARERLSDWLVARGTEPGPLWPGQRGRLTTSELLKLSLLSAKNRGSQACDRIGSGMPSPRGYVKAEPTPPKCKHSLGIPRLTPPPVILTLGNCIRRVNRMRLSGAWRGERRVGSLRNTRVRRVDPVMRSRLMQDWPIN